MFFGGNFALLRDPQGNVEVFQFDVYQAAAGANTLQLEIAVVGNEVFQVTTQASSPVYGGHGHSGFVADDHFGPFLGVDNEFFAGDNATVNISGVHTLLAYGLTFSKRLAIRD